MPGSVKQKKIDEISQKVRDALQRSAWFEAERLAMKALMMARAEQDFERMAGVAPLLWESRRQRMSAAMRGVKIKIVSEPVTEDMKVERGCYLVQPPQVGSDARRLRLAAFTAEVPVIVLCREPLTRTKLVPVVAISPNSTLRVKVDPPAKSSAPDRAWFTAALQALGDAAIEALDPTLPVDRRIDSLVEDLDALPEHENLHLALEAACRQAHEESQAAAKSPPKSAAKSKIKS
jgi:hypothetical protein